MRNPSKSALKSIVCCALLTMPAARGAPWNFSGKTATAPPKAIPVTPLPATAKVYVNASDKVPSGKSPAGKAPVAKTKPAQVAKTHKAAPPNSWQISPKVEARGKEDPVYGFMLKRPF